MGKDGFGCGSVGDGFQEAGGVTPIGQPESPQVEGRGIKDMDVGIRSLEGSQAVGQAARCHLA